MSAAPTSSTCRWPNCGREVLRHGFCARDLQRLRKQGLSTTEIPTLTAEDIQREYIAWTSNQPSPTIADSADPESAPRVASVAPEYSPVDVLQPDPLANLRAHLRGAPGSIGIADAALVAQHDVRQNSAMVAALDEMRAERDEARAESSSHLQFIDALLAAAGWKRGEDDSDAAKIAHVGQIIAERASWKESWQRHQRELASALGKKPEDASYQELLAIVREREDDRIVWNQRVTMMMGALPRHLFAGGERLDQMVVGVCRHLNELTALLTWADRTADPEPQVTTNAGIKLYRLIMAEERADDAVRLVSATLDRLGAPTGDVPSIELEPGETRPMRPHERLEALFELDPDILAAIDAALDDNCAPEIDGDKVKTRADRIHALVGHWQQAIYSTVCELAPHPERIDGAGSDAGPLELTLAEVSQGMAQLINGADEAARQHARDLAETTERASKREAELLDWLVQIRRALNVGPPSSSDVPDDYPLSRVVEVVRARSKLMLEERDQRVALGRLVERIAGSTGFATGPLLGQYAALEGHIEALAKRAAASEDHVEWLAERLADSTPTLRALIADESGFTEPLASLVAERAVPAGPGHQRHEERLVMARLFAAQLLSDPIPF